LVLAQMMECPLWRNAIVWHLAWSAEILNSHILENAQEISTYLFQSCPMLGNGFAAYNREPSLRITHIYWEQAANLWWPEALQHIFDGIIGFNRGDVIEQGANRMPTFFR